MSSSATRRPPASRSRRDRARRRPMKRTRRSHVGVVTVTLAIVVAFAPIGERTASAAGDVGFGKSLLAGSSSVNPTTLQFGPDGRLYVGQLDGVIHAYTIERLGYNQYTVTATQTINKVADILNHDDDGTPAPAVTGRPRTGLQ